MLLTMVEKLCVSLTLKKKKVCYARWPRHTKITMKNAKGVRKKFRVASCSVQGPHPSEQKMEKKKLLCSTLILNRTRTFNGTPIFNRTPILNRTRTFNRTPILSRTPILNRTPRLNRTPIFNRTPILNRSMLQLQWLRSSVRSCIVIFFGPEEFLGIRPYHIK